MNKSVMNSDIFLKFHGFYTRMYSSHYWILKIKFKTLGELYIIMKKNARNTKGKIVSAAWKLFYQQGYDNTTIEEIVEASGTSRGSFYHYFEGKDALLSSLSYLFDDKYVELEKTMDEKVLVKKCANAINKGQKTELSVNLTNIDRTFGTILGAEITRKNKNGLADDTITVHCNGAGGQSFGAFIPKGLTLELTGDSNDYFGKGLSGGKLILKVPEKAAYKAEENIIVGNVALYGATSGTAFINGVAGERFAVRNSGASAVVEGVGEHGCEYMTGGRVVVLGKTGKNFAAGMSGGIAYVLDVENVLYKNLNKAMISIEKVDNKYDKKELKNLIEAHVTGSELGQKVLDQFDMYLPHFKKLIPNEYKKMITLSAKLEEKGLNSEQAQMEAFYESIGVKH